MRPRRRLRRRLDCNGKALLACDGVGDNHRCDHAGGHRSENVVTVHPSPLVSMRRSAEMSVVVIDMLTALPILVLNLGAVYPFVVTDGMGVGVFVGPGQPIHADRSECQEK